MSKVTINRFILNTLKIMFSKICSAYKNKNPAITQRYPVAETTIIKLFIK